jgi:hypothetical protein
MITNNFKMAFLVCIAIVTVTSCNFTTEQKAETLEKAKANVEVAARTWTLRVRIQQNMQITKLNQKKSLRKMNF